MRVMAHTAVAHVQAIQLVNSKTGCQIRSHPAQPSHTPPPTLRLLIHATHESSMHQINLQTIAGRTACHRTRSTDRITTPRELHSSIHRGFPRDCGRSATMARLEASGLDGTLWRRMCPHVCVGAERGLMFMIMMMMMMSLLLLQLLFLMLLVELIVMQTCEMKSLHRQYGTQVREQLPRDEWTRERAQVRQYFSVPSAECDCLGLAVLVKILTAQ